MSDPTATKKRATYQDVLDAPEHKVAEIVAGELHVSPRPANPAAMVASALTGELYAPFHRGRGGSGGWILIAEPELHMSDDVVVPDVAGWRRERLPLVPDAAFIDVVPNWICEVLSPSTERFDRRDKMRLYADLGVEHAWLVQPRTRLIEAYRRHEGQWLLLGTHADTQVIAIEPFDAIELDLSILWADVPLPTHAGEEAESYAY